jgi:glucose/arabinose dehydrogenase
LHDSEPEAWFLLVLELMLQPTKRTAFNLVHSCVLVVAVGVVGCASAARLPVSAGTGPHPTLPSPSKSLIPVVHVVTAQGWPEGGKPVAAQGTAVAAFSRGLVHPRWLYVLPNGDVLVAETIAPERPKDAERCTTTS